MPRKFQPKYRISTTIAQNLVRIENVKNKVLNLPLTPAILHSLQETARLYTTHYSTMIEGNQLNPDQIKSIVYQDNHFPGREREEYEVKNYYAALHQVEIWVEKNIKITEQHIQQLHALIMTIGTTKISLTAYRDGQNIIRDSKTKAIVYMPPQADDVPILMQAMVQWLNNNQDLPCPIIAAIIHYQFATIHPYYDGNGRTARLLTTLILHLGGYDLKGLYSLEEYYAQNLNGYYQAIAIGDSHNDYMGRAQADITKWIEYFIAGMAISFEKVCKRMEQEKKLPDQSQLLRNLDARQRKALKLFINFSIITSRQISQLFKYQPRTASKMCTNWVQDGFLEIVNLSTKGRSYKLAQKYTTLITSK